MSDIEFKAFPKLARLNRECIITEKIDGTNACVVVTEDGRVAAQSRNRLITPATDPFGFARWVTANTERLRDTLGVGYHFGEWWGKGIQRGYGLAGKRLSLFNVARWGDLPASDDLAAVPLLYRGLFHTNAVIDAVSRLRDEGSLAARGFDRPEGVVVFHVAANAGFKVTLENDEKRKGES